MDKILPPKKQTLIPLRLAIYRIVNEHDGPIALAEIIDQLLSLGYTPTRRTILERLGELTCDTWPELRINRVYPGIYVRQTKKAGD